jgi:hypothetical protein
MSGGEPSLTSVSVHVGEGVWAQCHAYPDEAPILSVDAGRTLLNLLHRRAQ